jgi:hypothetical protein
MRTELQMTSIVEGWLKGTADTPYTVDQGMGQVMARLPRVRQRGRWWPLPSIGRQSSSRLPDAMAFPGPAVMPVADDRTLNVPSPVHASTVRQAWQGRAWGLAASGTLAAFLVVAVAAATFVVFGVDLRPVGTAGGEDTQPAAAPSPRPTFHGSIGFPPRGTAQSGTMVRESVWLSLPHEESLDWSDWMSDGSSTLTRTSDGASLRFWSATPDGVYRDPCAGVQAEPKGGSTAELVAAVATVPGTVLVSGPTDLRLSGRPATEVVLSVPEDAPCPADEFMLWYDEDLGGRSVSRLGDTITVWIIDVEGTRVWIDGEAHKNADLQSGEGLRRIVESIIPPAGEKYPFVFPPRGPLAVDTDYEWVVNPPIPTGIVRFSVPVPGWRSDGFDDSGSGGGSIERGTFGSPDWARITFSRPDRVYADPCSRVLADPLPSVATGTLATAAFGPVPDALAAAVAAVPGIDLVTAPTDDGLGSRYAMHLVIRIPVDIGCAPERFSLWADECVWTYYNALSWLCQAPPDPRTPVALGSTIRLWITDGFVVEAETLPGVSPIVLEEIERIIGLVHVDGRAIG